MQPGETRMTEARQATPERAYDKVLELLENPEPSMAWVKDFNGAALAMEGRDLNDEPWLDGTGPDVSAMDDEGPPAFKTTDESVVTTSNHGLPWFAFIKKGRLYIASPPILIKTALVRLVLDVMKPHRFEGDAHINVHAVPCDDRGKMLDSINNANTACLVIDPDAGPAMIFAGWDFVAREGLEAAIKAGAVTSSWAGVVTAKVPCTGGVPVSEEEAHAIKMLEVYAREKDLDSAIVMYRKVNSWAEHGSVACRSAANKYNKIRFYLMARDGHPDERYDLELRGIACKKANSTPRQFLAWLLNGKRLDGSYYKRMESVAEAAVYPDGEERRQAWETRNGTIETWNEIPGGLGIAPALIPESLRDHCPLPLASVARVDDLRKGRTNRDMAIKDALRRMGRASGKGLSLDGLYIVERLKTSTHSWRALYAHEAAIIDPGRKKSCLFEYTSVDVYSSCYYYPGKGVAR